MIRFKAISLLRKTQLLCFDVLLRTNLHSINFSVNTLDKDVWRNLEPATPSPLKRLEAVQTLSDKGFSVGVFLAPIVPFLTDSPSHPAEVVVTTKQHGARYLMPSVLRLTPEVKSWFLSVLAQHYPGLLPRYCTLYKTAYPPRTNVISSVSSDRRRYPLAVDLSTAGIPACRHHRFESSLLRSHR